MATPLSCSNNRRSALRQNSRHQTDEFKPETTENVSKKPGKVDVNTEVMKTASKSPRNRNPSKLEGKTYPLRSSLGSGRVLRSMSEAKGTTQSELVDTPEYAVRKGRKKEESISRQTEHKENVLLKSRNDEAKNEVTANKVAKNASKSLEGASRSQKSTSKSPKSASLSPKSVSKSPKSVSKSPRSASKFSKTPSRSPKGASESSCQQKALSSEREGSRYPLRSSLGTSRVLRSSMSQTECQTQPKQVARPVNSVTKPRKKRKNSKEASNDEFTKTRKRVRYLLTRMKYEQNLIDAYLGEGWKGHSAEKLKPEKELERAKSEILRCKFRIRELFHHLDSLSSEGRFEESLYDSEGEIDSEDIFCAKCGSKDLSTDNDIILCDGICDRGFHQKCLNPPLLSEDIPLGEDGWLCPACDCKVDCLGVLNEFHGSNITIEDTWEKVFPEAVTIANGDTRYDDLPSDDSEDYDYRPDGPEINVGAHKEGLTPEEPPSEESPSEESASEESAFDESDFTSASEDLDVFDSNKQNENLGFPSDDSEDDDFNPDAPVIGKSKDESSSDESDFTSDSDEFCKELSKTRGADEDSASSFKNLKPVNQPGDRILAGDRNDYGHLSLSQSGLNQENVLRAGKRQHERLDYKKLHDETYGKSSSDSSDDEEWSEKADISTPCGTKGASREDFDEPLKANLRTVRTRKGSQNMFAEVDTRRKSGECRVAEQHHDRQLPDSNRNKSSIPSYKRMGDIAKQKLYESFQEKQYPTREEKESLAEELGLTYRQVDKWFGNSRHYYRHSVKGMPSESVPPPSKGGSDLGVPKNQVPSDGYPSPSGSGINFPNSTNETPLDGVTSPNNGSNNIHASAENASFDKIPTNLGGSSYCVSTNEAPSNLVSNSKNGGNDFHAFPKEATSEEIPVPIARETAFHVSTNGAPSFEVPSTFNGDTNFHIFTKELPSEGVPSPGGDSNFHVFFQESSYGIPSSNSARTNFHAPMGEAPYKGFFPPNDAVDNSSVSAKEAPPCGFPSIYGGINFHNPMMETPSKEIPLPNNGINNFSIAAKEVPSYGVPSPVNAGINFCSPMMEMPSSISFPNNGGMSNPDADLVQSPASSGVKRKKSLPAKQQNVGASSIDEDEERQKAIARELRKIKQRR